ncbi:MAG: hypothetical protein L6R42_011209, partial [Xanthoria sp. 1 TBL-2021]
MDPFEGFADLFGDVARAGTDIVSEVELASVGTVVVVDELVEIRIWGWAVDDVGFPIESRTLEKIGIALRTHSGIE